MPACEQGEDDEIIHVKFMKPETMDGCQLVVLSSSRSPFSSLGCATRMALCCDAGSTSGKPSE